MLLRISLIVALVAGLAALYVGHFQVSERLTTLTTNLETAENNAAQARAAEQKARAEAKSAREELAEANAKLDDAVTTLNTTTEQLAQQKARADELFDNLTNVTRERNEAQTELAAYQGTGLRPEQIREQRELYNKIVSERNAFVAENKVLLRNVEQLKNELSRFIGDREQVVELPPGLKGNVVAVDPKYDFVVLDIGGNQGVLENGQMLVNRDGKLVAKVRITRVEPNRSIANIVPGWKQDEVMEGDQVVY